MKSIETEITGQEKQQAGGKTSAKRSGASFSDETNEPPATYNHPIWDCEAKIMHFRIVVINELGFG